MGRFTRSQAAAQSSQAETQTQQQTPRPATAKKATAAKRGRSANNSKRVLSNSVVDSSSADDPDPKRPRSNHNPPAIPLSSEANDDEESPAPDEEPDEEPSNCLPDEVVDALLKFVYNNGLGRRVVQTTIQLASDAIKENWGPEVLRSKLKIVETEKEEVSEAEEDNRVVEDEDEEGTEVAPASKSGSRNVEAKAEKKKQLQKQVRKLQKEIKDIDEGKGEKQVVEVKGALLKQLGEPMLTFIKDCVKFAKQTPATSVVNLYNNPVFQSQASVLLDKYQMQDPAQYISTVAKVNNAADELTEGLRGGRVFDLPNDLSVTRTTNNLSPAETISVLILTTNECKAQSKNLEVGSVKTDMTLYTFVLEHYIGRAIDELGTEIRAGFDSNNAIVEEMASQRKKRGLTDDEKAKLKKAQRWLHEAKTGWRKDQKVEWPKHRVQIVTKFKQYLLNEADYPDDNRNEDDAKISGGEFRKFWDYVKDSLSRGYNYYRLSQLTSLNPEKLARIKNYYKYATLSEERADVVLDEITRQLLGEAKIVEIVSNANDHEEEETDDYHMAWGTMKWVEIREKLEEWYGLTEGDRLRFDNKGTGVVERHLTELRKIRQHVNLGNIDATRLVSDQTLWPLCLEQVNDWISVLEEEEKCKPGEMSSLFGF